MGFNLDQEIDKLAELVAQRSKRKAGKPRDLRLVGAEKPPEPDKVAQAALPNWAELQAVDVSPRAKAMHEIMVIANNYGWQIAVTHFLMTRGVPYLSDLTDPQLDDLLDRMHGYVDACEVDAFVEDGLQICGRKSG
ncbi:hypothetical protein [Pseudoxanthomonas sp. X-1]|uniref:hypothetical protein n=1 Tax=Pseudoxanthomonas sp. X-1 TaxID=2571115 RepID=UPI00110A6C46|nr:hypothetical protein [Pseudoxanthomonas sp. X-1]TMN18489.1 hypothetical protein FF950_14510 [Pseudoxanthomonas sp. X-1]UAY76007.1 hypothetical protein LAJ50_07155 [Pseudoxanthomonas sp. X-1]